VFHQGYPHLSHAANWISPQKFFMYLSARTFWLQQTHRNHLDFTVLTISGFMSMSRCVVT